MLAKQAWKLIHNMHSLFYRDYKAWYFPDCSFLKATVGSNPSYVWRSVLAAQEIIRKWSRWQVGNGWRIIVTDPNWFPRSPCLIGVVPPSMRVCEVIDESIGQWDRAKLSALFSPSKDRKFWLYHRTQLPRTSSYGWKIRTGISRLEQRIRWLFVFSSRTMWNTLRLGLMDQSWK